MTHRLWRPPTLYPIHQNKDAEERKIGWLELFYDLVFVAAIVQLGDLLSEDVTLTGLFEFVMLFIPIWWAWVGFTFYMNRYETDDIWHRLLVFIQIFAVANMAILIVNAFGPSANSFAFFYVLVRLVLMAQYGRAWRAVPETRPLTARFALGFGLAALIWLVSIAVPPPFKYVLWGIGILADLAVPFIGRMRVLTAIIPPDMSHAAERFGNFTLIVFGESFLKSIITLGGEPVRPAALVFGLLSTVLVACLWWIYFDDIAGATIKQQTHVGRGTLIWLYAHLPLAIGIAAVAVAISKVIALDFSTPLSEHYRWLLSGATALSLVAVAALDSVTDRTDSTASSTQRAVARLVSAAIILLLGLVGGLVPTLLFLGLVTLAAVAQVLFDLRGEAQAAVADDHEEVECADQGRKNILE